MSERRETYEVRRDEAMRTMFAGRHSPFPEEIYRFKDAYDLGWNAAIAHVAALLDRERRL